MSPSVRILLFITLVLLASCGGATPPPALVLQLSQITRTRATERAHERRRELAFTAAVWIGLETTGAESIQPQALDPPNALFDPVRCEPVESAICVWARAAEESDWLAAHEHVEVPP